MHSLPLFHRISQQSVIVLGEGPAADAKRRLVERAGGRVVGEADPHARLAFVVLDSPETVAQRLRDRGILVNVADRPELCDFTLPSVLERGPMLVAVSSGGASAGLTKALRLRLEALLPEALGRLAEALGAARGRIKARWPDPDKRRRVLDAAVGEGGALDLMADHAPDALDRWLDGGTASNPQAQEFTVASDDPDDLTLRQARLLGTADIVRHDPRIAAGILNRARADAERRALDDPRPDRGIVVVLRRT